MEIALPPILRDLPEELLGPRVRLRPIQTGDGPALWEATEESREHIGPWMSWIERNRQASDSEEAARRAHTRWISREAMSWGIWDKDTGRFLGQCALVRPDWTLPSFEIGYWLRASAEGHGYMTEALKIIRAVAFQTLEAQRIHIQCDSLNQRSASVARRLGFVHEATLRNHERSVGGELRDTLVFAMTPDDFAQANIQADEMPPRSE